MLLKTALGKMVRFSSGEKQCPRYESSRKQWLYKYELVMLLLSNVLFFNVMAGRKAFLGNVMAGNPDGGIVHQDSEPNGRCGVCRADMSGSCAPVCEALN